MRGCMERNSRVHRRELWGAAHPFPGVKATVYTSTCPSSQPHARRCPPTLSEASDSASTLTERARPSLPGGSSTRRPREESTPRLSIVHDSDAPLSARSCAEPERDAVLD